jgi:hypothetical protein
MSQPNRQQARQPAKTGAPRGKTGVDRVVENDFKVGEEYTNEKGIFKVISIKAEQMIIRWENGEELKSTVDIQRRIQERRTQERIAEEKRAEAAAAKPARAAAKKARKGGAEKNAPGQAALPL